MHYIILVYYFNGLIINFYVECSLLCKFSVHFKESASVLFFFVTFGILYKEWTNDKMKMEVFGS